NEQSDGPDDVIDPRGATWFFINEKIHNTNPGQKKQGPERKSGTEKFHADVFPLLIVNEVSLTGNGSDAVF
ncbi:hypothetical protein ACMB9A_005555, partial [Escherichia coli]